VRRFWPALPRVVPAPGPRHACLGPGVAWILALALAACSGAAPPAPSANATIEALTSDLQRVRATATAATQAAAKPPPTARNGTTAQPTAVPTALPRPAVTDRPTPSPVPTLWDPPAVRWHTVLDERFADNRHSWPDDPRSTGWFGEGGYHLFARYPTRFVAIGAPIAEPLRDGVVTGIFHKVGGPPGGGYGLIVRDQGPGPRDGLQQGGRYYVLEVGDRGEFGIWRREEDRWIDLIPWTPTAAVRPGSATNELMVQAIGQHMTFSINGIQVASQVVTPERDGRIGVFAGGDLNEVVVDRFTVQVPT
jgi:hypothetical protein